MDDVLLRTFAVLAEELHFTRAAERLGISQPPLSQRIKRLEELVGAPLFQRTSRRVLLTDIGHAFAAEARRLIDDGDRALARMRRMADGETGELRLALTTSVPLLPVATRIIGAFRAERPQVALTIAERHSEAQIDAIIKGTLDAGFMRLPSSSEGMLADLTRLRLDDEPLAVFVPADDPMAREVPADGIAIATLADRPFVMFPARTSNAVRAEAVRLCEAAGFTPHIAQEAAESLTLCGMVAAGIGIAILPQSFARIGVGGLAALPIARQPGSIVTWLAAARGAPSPLTSALFAHARTALRTP